MNVSKKEKPSQILYEEYWPQVSILYEFDLCISQFEALPSPGRLLKNSQILAPRTNFQCQIPGRRALLGPLILVNFILFKIFKTSVINLPIEYLQIRRENTDLSIKNM